MVLAAAIMECQKCGRKDSIHGAVDAAAVTTVVNLNATEFIL